VKYPSLKNNMKGLSPKFICQLYILVVLLVSTTLAALPYSALSLLLLLAMLFVTFHPLQPSFNLALTIAMVFLVPLVLSPVLNYLTLTTSVSPALASFITALLTLPMLYLLDCSLKEKANVAGKILRGRKGRHTTYTYVAIFSATLATLLISFVIDSPVLLFAGLFLALYQMGILISALRTIRTQPLEITSTMKRIVAGETAEITFSVKNMAKSQLYCLLESSEPWLKATPRKFSLDGNTAEIRLKITPPLAGPILPSIHAFILDSRGLIQINQVLEPIELHVIPRAKYAEWLAKKYLEYKGSGTGGADMLAQQNSLLPKRGTDYHDSRTYQPGDQLRYIDWKHSAKLGQLIVKEYVDAGEQAAIIAVNLAVTSAEEADKLAYNLITTALTLARESIPTALAAYNHEDVVLTTPMTDPREAVKHTLSLIKQITRVEATRRYLQPPDIGRLRSTIARLKKADSEPCRKLLGMLDFEYRALNKMTENHPAAIALSRVTRKSPSPSVIVLISEWNHDAEAMLVTTEKLSRQEFSTIDFADSH